MRHGAAYRPGLALELALTAGADRLADGTPIANGGPKDKQGTLFSAKRWQKSRRVPRNSSIAGPMARTRDCIPRDSEKEGPFSFPIFFWLSSITPKNFKKKAKSSFDFWLCALSQVLAAQRRFRQRRHANI